MKFAELRSLSTTVQNRLTEMSAQFPWENPTAYGTWLGQTYEYAAFSTRILALAAGHFPLDKTLFSTRFIQHAAEEKGHDRLLANDAKALDLELKEIPVLPEAEAFHKSLYFWIYQGRPTVILGWILALECFAVENGPKIFKRVEQAYGRKAASFLFVHSEEDEEHVEKAFATIEKLSEFEIDEVAHGLKLYSALYENMYRAIATQSRRGGRADRAA